MTDLVLKVAAKAVIEKDGKLLVLREANTYEEGTNIGRYGFPGGRLNSGESYEDGLRREVKEETGLQIEISHPVYVGEWRPVIKGVPTQIIAIFTVCKLVSGTIALSEEHDKYEWVDPKNVTVKTMSPDGIVIKKYLELRK